MSTPFQLQSETLSSKELPHNIEAEQGILGAILLNIEIFYDISETINIDHFYEPVHRLVFEVIGKIISRGQIATPITLKSYFEVEKNLEDNKTVYFATSFTEKKYVPNFLIERDLEVTDVNILLSGLKLVGDYLDKTI